MLLVSRSVWLTAGVGSLEPNAQLRRFLVADVRAFNTTPADTGKRREDRERRKEGWVHENVINSVNSGGSAQLESIELAAQVPGAIDSSQESELFTTM